MLTTSWKRFDLLDPYLYQGKARNYKESCFLTLDFKGQTYLSELSVFPGLHETNRAFYQRHLPQDLFQNLELPKQAFQNLTEVTSWAHQYYSAQLPPNTLQALDTLLLEVLGQSQKLPKKWQALYQESSWCCACAHLITQLDQALHLQQLEGTYKIKVGRAALAQEIKWLKQWIKQNPKSLVRLDANSMWSASQVEALLNELGPKERSALEYLEDPCPPEDWNKINSPDKIPLALEKRPAQWPAPDVRVYRPSSEKGLLLGLFELEQHIQESANIDVVLSSSFETELGLRWCIWMANILGLKRAQGLGTLTHLAPDTPAPAKHFQARFEGPNLCLSHC